MSFPPTALAEEIAEFVDQYREEETDRERELAKMIDKFSTSEGFWYQITQASRVEAMVEALVEEPEPVLDAINLLIEFEDLWNRCTWDM